MQKEQKRRKCATCAENFQPTSQRQVYCAACGREHRKAKQREYKEAYTIRWYGGKKS